MTDMNFVYGLLAGGIGVFVIIASIGLYMFIKDTKKTKKTDHKENNDNENDVKKELHKEV